MLLTAIILAGGQGKRLRPLTDYVPKPLIPINNIPIIEWQLVYLSKFDIKQVIISIGYKSDMIENYFETRDLDIEIKFSIESKSLGTGGAIKLAAQNSKEESMFVLNGDIITDIDIRKLDLNTIAAVPLRTKFGVLDIDGSNVVQFHEKQYLNDVWMNAGIYNLSKEMINDLPNEGDIEKTTFPRYAKMKKLYVKQYATANWYSIDSIKDMEQVSTEISSII